MSLAALCALLGAALSVSGNIPYDRGILARRPDCRPRLVSWVIWSETLAIGAIQASRTLLWPDGIYTAACAAGNITVLVIGWKFGDGHKVNGFDKSCLALAQAGVLLLVLSVPWPGIIPPWAGVLVAVGTDLLAFAPTALNGLRGREPFWPFALFAAGSAVVLVTTDFEVLAAAAYPVYLVASDGAMALLVLAVRARSIRRSSIGRAASC